MFTNHQKQILLLILIYFNLNKIEQKLLYPPVEYLAVYKPTLITPTGSTCGLDLKDTLCDNRFQDDKSCSNTSSIFFCDQSCPYGNVLESLNDIEQLKLENMNPCVVFKDFTYILSNNSNKSINSYYFDKSNNLCSLSSRVVVWRPFSLELNKANPKLSFYNSRTSSLSIIDSGFSFSLWFTQSNSNNGTLLSLVRDDNTNVFILTVQTITKKIYLNYMCDLEQNKVCFVEINAFKMISRGNFLALRIFKSSLELFLNEPNNLNENLSINPIELGFDLGTFIVNNSKRLNFYIGTDLNENSKYYGWIQDFKLFLIPLVNVEIAELYGKDKNNEIKIQSECRCPNEYPKNVNENSTFCIRNRNDQLSLIDKQLRLNEFAHPLNYINDDDFKTNWISCVLTISNPIEIVLDLLNGVYLLQRIEIFFSSLPPTNVLIERFENNKWFLLQKYSTDCDGSNSSCVQLPKEFLNDMIGGYTMVWSANIENEESFLSNQTQVDNSKASKIRLIMSGYYPNSRKDIRKLYYSIDELRIKGRCDCNGYSSVCDMRGTPFKCQCDSESNTEGPMCNRCLPIYNNQIYQRRYLNSTATCSKCDCNNRSQACLYDSNLNSGVCQNCSENTIGKNCEKCALNHFFNPLSRSCQNCACNPDGVLSSLGDLESNCDQLSGKCKCKSNVEGQKCDKCKPGYFNYSNSNPDGCNKCDCNPNASVSLGNNLTLCDEITGQCKCVSQFVEGIKCDTCMESTYNLGLGCTFQCNCDPFGSLGASCDELAGQCKCKPRISGLKCNICEPGYYNLTSFGCVNKCNCNPIGSFNQTFCDSKSGKCSCKIGYTGKNCDSCVSGYWKSNNECIQCKCNLNGVLDANNICEPETGKCICNDFSEGFMCDTCKAGYYGVLTKDKCKKCECDPIGTSKKSLVNGNYICDRITSQCVCNKNRIGIRCESCAVGYFFLNLNNIDCLECNCDPVGSVPGSNCDSLTGECVCKVSNGIGGTRCDQCSEGFYNFSRTTGSCSPCNCNIAGSEDQFCDQVSGQCYCKEFVIGDKCNICMPGTSNLDIKNPFGCSKSPSKQSPPRFTITKADSIFVNWNPPDYPNGIIRYYLLFRNDTLVHNTSGTSFEDRKVQPFTIYSYSVQSFNDEGNTTSRMSLIAITLPTQPCCKFTYRISTIRSSQIQVIWNSPEKLNGLNLLYFIKVFRIIDKTKPNSLLNLQEQLNSSVVLEHNSLKDKEFNYQVENLIAYTNYYLDIKACNRDLTDTNRLYCLDGTPEFIITKIETETFISFITSQDRPEFQPMPSLISLNSSYVIIGVNRPNRPNGIILLYEIWIRSFDNNNSTSERKLACAIEDLYDQNDLNSLSLNNTPKICIVRGLSPNSQYGLIATSSTIIGRSSLSSELLLTTLENQPVCSPSIQNVFSYESDKIYFSWLPSLNISKNNSFWKNCIGGSLKNFTIYQLEANKKFKIYTGVENSFNLTNLNSSTDYFFTIELCNGIGCVQSELIRLRTLDPPPNPWLKNDLKYEFINSSCIKFDWSSYKPFSRLKTNSKGIKYRLERSKISFSYPPTPLESGVRFHGYNYFKFPSSKYFPDGYPYFGLKYSFKTKKDSALVYFAASSYAQSELTALQLLNNQKWFISNTQSSQTDSCSIYLNLKPVRSLINEWSSIEMIRVNNFAYMRLNELNSQLNSSQCSNQVITDLTGVYLGGVPDGFITRDESKFLNTNYKLIQKNRFYGCLKNISTLVRLVNLRTQLNSSLPITETINFNFSDAEISPGDAENSNTIYGCPLNLDTNLKPVYLLGYGYLYTNLKQTIPIIFQTNKFLIVDFDFRTELADGFLYFNYDINNEQFLIVRIFNSTHIEIDLKTRVRYNSLNSTDNTFSNFFDILFNQTFGISQSNLNNGYWSNLNIQFDFLNRTLLVIFNQTRIGLVNLLNKETIPSNLDQRVLSQPILFTFYLNVQFYFGGYDLNQIPDILKSLSQSFVSDLTRRYFIPLFEFIYSLNNRLYFSGCIRDIKVNSFPIDFFNLNNIVEYKNVRFDGCPNLSNQMSNYTLLIDSVTNHINLTNAYDSSFLPFTEYFYRVIAYNSEGESPSDWFLIRTPETSPNLTIDINKYLNSRPISGYKIQVENITNFCFYCTFKTNPFTGIIQKFILTVKNSNLTRNYTFYCETSCTGMAQTISNENIYDNYLKEDKNPFDKLLLIDTTPITLYSLMISVCNNVDCVQSDYVDITTLGEIPDGLSPPELISRSSDSLNLFWRPPKYPSGNITGYILRQISIVDSVIYFGLRNEFKVINLKPLSNYSFSLEVCNSIGCSRSSLVSFQTSEMAPLSVNPPLVLKITQDMIILKWTKPDNQQIQSGFLTNYFLYINEKELLTNTSQFFNISTCTECSSNIKDITNLIPGSEYIIILAACTSGGCTNSSEVRVKTLESMPLVDDIRVSSTFKTSSIIRIEWNRPSRPNGQFNKFILYQNDKKIYEGNQTEFTVSNLAPNSFYFYRVEFCNNFGCSTTKPVTLNTDESIPEGSITLEAQAKGSNQIELKFYASTDQLFKPNGNILYSIYVNGPFLINNTINYLNLNLLNTTVPNTKYGILDRILPFSIYTIQVNASNTKGFLLSNQVQVETVKSNPDLVMPPQLSYKSSRSLKIEWNEPLLINSEDKIIFYQLSYRSKKLWNENGPILNPIYENDIQTIFPVKTLTNYYILNNLEPFTAYSFQLTASNSFGESKSEWSQDYTTEEESPKEQSSPIILNYTSTSVEMSWKQAKIPNGLIRNFKINIFKYLNRTSFDIELRIVQVINLKNNIFKFNITKLDPFSYYLFTIESCNSISCVMSDYDKVNLLNNENLLVQTKPFRPENVSDPVVSSPNSYSIEIKWNLPLKPNGIIKNYILERIDFVAQFGSNRKKSRKYLFNPDKLRFLDDNDLEPCGLYSYRLTVFNQVASVSSNYINITVKPSKPLVVTAPLVNPLNTTSARFEWTKPLTYCEIKKYSLILKTSSNTQVFDYDNETKSSIVSTLYPFQIYEYNLIACVDLLQDPCSISLSKKFQTSGAPPSGLRPPVVRLISPKAISIEWLEPANKNGGFLVFELIRFNLKLNRTENLYSGSSAYYLDMNLKSFDIYQYKVVYTNEFGTSVSILSDQIEVGISYEDILKNNTVLLNLGLQSECLSSTSVLLKWDLLKINEINNLLKNLPGLWFENLTLINQTILIEYNSTSFDYFISNGLNSLKNLDLFLTNLRPGLNYKFRLNYNLVLDLNRYIILTSEMSECTTKTLDESFSQTFINVKPSISLNYLNISFNIGGLIPSNYELYEIYLNKTENFASNETIDSKLFTETNGFHILGPYNPNLVYTINLRVCSLNLNKFKSNSIFQSSNCIENNPKIYSVSTEPPKQLQPPLFTLINSTNLQINLNPPLKPNGYNLNYQIYKRYSCNLNLIKEENICDQKDGFICCGGVYYRPKIGFKCCANTFYIYVPDGYSCCQSKESNKNEIRIGISQGDLCCDDEPFFNSSIQFCCNDELKSISKKCYNIPKIPEKTLCDDFVLIYNSSRLDYLDTNLDPFTSYDYKYCVENDFSQTCFSYFSVTSQPILPEKFNQFEYELVKDSYVFLKWDYPLRLNGELIWFKLIKNGFLIYKGKMLFYEDRDSMNELTLNIYEIEVCNQAGCIQNENILLVSGNNLKPEGLEPIQIINLTHNTALLEIKLPLKINGVMKNFILSSLQIGVEIDIKFSFNSNLTSLNISREKYENFTYSFSSYSLLSNKKKLFYINLTDLSPWFEYKFNLSACNLVGCITRPIEFTTKDHYLNGFQNGIIYVLNETVIDLVWTQPNEINGELVKFNIYRNDKHLTNLTVDKEELGFYSYTDFDLRPNEFYEYKIEAMNMNYEIMSDKLIVRTPPIGKVIKQCGPRMDLSNETTVINLLNILLVKFTVNDSDKIELEYSLNDWKNLINCLNKDQSSFSIKILIHSQSKGLQSLDFPYPNESDRIKNYISGLEPFNNYSIRLSFHTNFPKTQVITTEPIYLQTFEKEPCCRLDPPFITKLNYTKSISIKWSLPTHLNGLLKQTKLIRLKYKYQGCLKTREIESEIQLTDKGFLYDSGKNELIYQDTEQIDFSYYAYKIIVYNSVGRLESEPSELIHSWEYKAPSQPIDLRVLQVYPNGFRLKFQDPINYNGILSHYLIYIKPLQSYKPEEKVDLIFKPNQTCKFNLTSNYFQIPINGLKPFRTYNVTVIAVNRLGVKSEQSEYVIANTLESTPEYLSNLIYIESEKSILFKFNDPREINGIFKQFNLYQFINPNYELIYEGLNREFLYSNLESFKNYSFIYEACTSIGCTRSNSLVHVQTLESEPEEQEKPFTERVEKCFKINFKQPAKPNGLINKILVFRLITSLDEIEKREENLISLDNFKTNFIIDCDLKANFYYSYRIISFNSKGKVSSSYSNRLISNLTQPDGLSQLNVTQIDHNLVQLEWFRPLNPNSKQLTFNLYRNLTLIQNLTNSTLNVFKFNDNFDFLPNCIYLYNLFVCNEAGCSTDENNLVKLMTKNRPPLAVKPPELIDLTATSATLNGFKSVILKSEQTQKIIEYKLYLNNILTHTQLNPVFTLTNLTPFTEYKAVLEACTFKPDGCLKSDNLIFQTNETFPSDLSDLIFKDVPQDNFRLNVEITWSLPKQTNGILEQIQLKRDNELILSTNKIDINFYIDFNLNYGVNYSYELSYKNGYGQVRVINYHLTIENKPYGIEQPICGPSSENEIFLKWSKPKYSNGQIRFYEIKYKPYETDEWRSVKIISETNLFYQLKELDQGTLYDIQLGVCNSIGCSYSEILSNDSKCMTLIILPDRVDPPKISETYNQDNDQTDLLIKWSKPSKSYVLNYILYRTLIEASICYDRNYSVKTNDVMIKKEIYKGMFLSFVDRNLGSFNMYDYYIDVIFQTGVRSSPVIRHITTPSEPKYLFEIGSLLNVYNDSVQLGLRPPLSINGDLINIYVLVKRDNDYFQNEIEIYNKSLNLNSNELVKYLRNNVTIRGLESNKVYELKSKFCNQIGCLVSLQTIRIKTLMNDKISLFEAISESPNIIRLKWAFSYGNMRKIKRIKYELRFINYYSNILIYQGENNEYLFNTAKPFTEYKFELLAFNTDQMILIDRKTTTVTTLPDSKITMINEYPRVNIVPHENNTAAVEIDWEKTFKINSPLKTFDLIINNKTVYNGVENKFKTNLVIKNCLTNTKFVNSTVNQSGYFNVDVRLRLNTLYETITTPDISFLSNCTVDPSDAEFKNEKILWSKTWFLFLPFITGLLLIIVISLSIIFCLNKSRNHRKSETLSNTSTASFQKDYIERNLKYLEKFNTFTSHIKSNKDDENAYVNKSESETTSNIYSNNISLKNENSYL